MYEGKAILLSKQAIKRVEIYLACHKELDLFGLLQHIAWKEFPRPARISMATYFLKPSLVMAVPVMKCLNLGRRSSKTKMDSPSETNYWCRIEITVNSLKSCSTDPRRHVLINETVRRHFHSVRNIISWLQLFPQCSVSSHDLRSLTRCWRHSLIHWNSLFQGWVCRNLKKISLRTLPIGGNHK